MTVVRHILLAVLTLSPLTAWGQVFTSPESRAIDGNGNGFPSQSNFGAITEAGYQEGPGSGFQPDQNALLMQGGAAYQLPPQVPPEVLAQQQQLQQQMLQRKKASTSRHYSSPIWQTSAKGGYFGIMGAIAQPGVYFHAEQRITLGDLLQLAGGPLPTASGGVRIVRQGRGGMQTFLSPESQHEIMNGDVVLLESHRPQGKSGLRDYPNTAATGGSPPSSNATAGTKTSPIAHLAFVNLLPHPVVVPVPSDQATLLAVMKWLHQDEESPPFVRVIAPSPALRPSPGRPVEQQLLENGSVLVFDPATIKRERLPPFPPVIGQIPTPGPATVPGPPRTTPAELPDAAQPAQISPTQTPSQPTKPPAIKPLRPAPPATTQREPRSAELQQYGHSQPGLAPATHFNGAPHQGGPQTGGPLLMMPQSQRPSRPQATNPSPNSRPSLPPKRLNSQADDQTTPANYVGQPMSWQQRPGVGANVGQPEVDDFGVVQAHGEADPLNNEFAGPILELPQPVPKFVDAVPLAAQQLAQASTPATAPKLSSSSFSMRIVWFSMGSLLLLVVGLWCMTRWDRPRPIRASIPTSHTSRFRTSTPPVHGTAAPQLGLRILKHTGKSLAEAPSPMTPVTQPVPEPVRAKPTVPAPTPGPTRTISREEQRLRELFHQSRPPQVTAPVPAPIPAKSVSLQPPVATRQPVNVTPDELRQLTGRSTVTVDKLASAPSPMKSPVQPTAQRSDSPGNLLDRVLRAQQKR